MAEVIFPEDLGGDGLVVTDDANPDTGLAAGGHRLRFVPALANTVAVARTAKQQAALAQTLADQVAADRKQTGEDRDAIAGAREATAADREQTGQDAASASASKASAASSQTAAKSSESKAANSAAAAAGSQSAAKSSETNAASSAGSAASSASAASASRMAAADSQSAAKASESSAGSSAAAAKQSASAAAALYADLDAVENARKEAVGAKDDAIAAAERVETTLEFEQRIDQCTVLDLDFAKGRYYCDDGSGVAQGDGNAIIQNGRAATSFAVGPNGFFIERPANALKREWDITSREPRGLVMTEARTNLLPYSRDFSQWLTYKMSIKSVGDILTPFNDFNAYVLNESAEDGTHRLHSSVDYDPSQKVKTAYFILKPNGREWAYVCYDYGYDNLYYGAWFNLQLGVIGIQEDGVYAQMVELANGWYLCSVRKELPESQSSVRVAVLGSTSNGSRSHRGEESKGYYVCFAQLENGYFWTSPILTAGAAASRDRDDVSHAVGSELNPFHWSVVVDLPADAYIQGSMEDNRIIPVFKIGTDTNSSFQGIGFQLDGLDVNFIIRQRGAGAFNRALRAPAFGSTRYRVGMSVNLDSGGMIFAINGTTVKETIPVDAKPNFSELQRIWLGTSSRLGGADRVSTPNLAMTRCLLMSRALSESELARATR